MTKVSHLSKENDVGCDGVGAVCKYFFHRTKSRSHVRIKNLSGKKTDERGAHVLDETDVGNLKIKSHVNAVIRGCDVYDIFKVDLSFD